MPADSTTSFYINGKSVKETDILITSPLGNCAATYGNLIPNKKSVPEQSKPIRGSNLRNYTRNIPGQSTKPEIRLHQPTQPTTTVHSHTSITNHTHTRVEINYCT